MHSALDRLLALLGRRPAAKVLLIVDTARGTVAVPVSKTDLRKLR
jgi:hypothetical protein